MVTIKSMLAGFLTALNYLLGRFDTAVFILAAFVVVDFITGAKVAFDKGQLSSKKAFDGIYKKILLFVLVGVGHGLDLLGGFGYPVFRNLVLYYLIATEGISILENTAKSGIRVPSFLQKAFREMLDNVDRQQQQNSPKLKEGVK